MGQCEATPHSGQGVGWLGAGIVPCLSALSFSSLVAPEPSSVITQADGSYLRLQEVRKCVIEFEDIHPKWEVCRLRFIAINPQLLETSQTVSADLRDPGLHLGKLSFALVSGAICFLPNSCLETSPSISVL